MEKQFLCVPRHYCVCGVLRRLRTDDRSALNEAGVHRKFKFDSTAIQFLFCNCLTDYFYFGTTCSFILLIPERVCWQCKWQISDWTAGPLVWSQQSGAEHAQNCGDDSGLHGESPLTIPWTWSGRPTSTQSSKRPSTGIILLCASITVWFGSATKKDSNRLKQIIRTAEKIISANLHSIQDFPEPGNGQETSLQTHHASHTTCSNWWHYRALYAKTTRHKNSFLLYAITLMNC